MDPVFFLREDALAIARELIGKRLCTNFGTRTAGIITETEAYLGEVDKASHAYGGRRTKRTEPMYAIGGTAYIYLCYGMHHLFNIVTGPRDLPHAILIRAIKPIEGISTIEARRKGRRPLAGGPGTVSQALGITTKQTGLPLGEAIWIEEGISPDRIATTPRIGIDYAGDHAHLPYRFVLKSSGKREKIGKI